MKTLEVNADWSGHPVEGLVGYKHAQKSVPPREPFLYGIYL